MNWQLFGTFLLITTVVVLAPGPIVTLVIATGARKGTRAGLVTVAGTSAGNAILLIAIALGLNWVVRNAVVVFELLRWGGAAYLIWTGIQVWLRAGRGEATAPATQIDFWRGLLVGISNPKAIAFYTAFLPQFLDPVLPPQRQLAVMCAATIMLGAVTDSSWAILSGLGRAWFMTPARAKLLGRLSGLTLLGGGIWLSLSRRLA